MADRPQPMLTIAIPTFNRSGYLRELLDAVVPQVMAEPDVELLVSDNGSADDTPAVLAGYQAALRERLRVVRQRENIGSDANFVFCFAEARGRYVWIVGDDDILVPERDGRPGAVARLLRHVRASDYDLIYATSFAFRERWQDAVHGDPLGREFHVVPSAKGFVRIVNIMFTFISGIVVNKERFLALRRDHAGIEDPGSFVGTNLPQLSWTLPLLRAHRRSLVLWDRPVGGRQGNAHGYSLGDVFGRQLMAVARRCLPDRPDLVRTLEDMTLRRWLPSTVFALRTSSAAQEEIAADMMARSSALQETYGRNWRFWLFTWPVLRWPLPLAKLALRGGAGLAKLLYALEVPGWWRRRREDAAR